jgi:small subunit ribosomal protein S16
LVLAVKIRLARHGAKKRPYYRVVVADAHSRRDGRFLEQVGRYNPLTKPALIELDLDKINAWMKNGAQPTERVAALIARYSEAE